MMMHLAAVSVLCWSPLAPRMTRPASAVRAGSAPVMDLTVGVVAIQGGFAEHMASLQRHDGVTPVEVRTPSELAGCDAIILPGGESTAIGHGLVDASLLQPLREFVKSKPAWGVCAGLILLADRLDTFLKKSILQALYITSGHLRPLRI